MAAGRKTGGRKKGVKNKRTAERERRLAAAVERVKEVLPLGFEGEAHDLLMLIYKDTSMPIETRLDAAKVAIRYEKPALAAVQHSGKDGGPIEGRITIEFVEPPKRKK
jgi:hypothetical protein